MPLWLLIISVVVITIGFCVFIHILWLAFIGCSIRDNYVFDNKYERKVFVLQEKLKQYDEKVKHKISCLKCKSTYVKNVEILHKISLDIPMYMDSKDFMKINKKKGK